MNRWIPYLGAAFTLLLLVFLVWRVTSAPVHVPKPRRQAAVIELDVCGWPLETVQRWMQLVPICSFSLTGYPPGRCREHGDVGYLVMMGPAPQTGDHAAAATTRITMATVEGWYRTPEIRAGVAVDREVGTMASALAIVPRGASDLVGAHELGHVCGYDHAVQGPNSHVWAPGQVMSAKTERQGHGVKGMLLRAEEYEPELIQW